MKRYLVDTEVKMKNTHISIYSDIIEKLAESSTCDRAKVGCLILKDGRIISTGYNGSLPGEPHCCDKRNIKIIIEDDVKKAINFDDNHLMKNGHCIRTIHAEQNAICNAAKNGIALKDCEMFVTHSPCPICTKLAIMSGIKRIYYLEPYNLEENPFKNIIEFTEVKR